ncbi:hypothetical protein C8J57DRAFT_1361542, partial [Mycena rebaudengoi]
MLTIPSSRRHVDPIEVGENNPLDDCDIRNQEDIILKVRLTTSSPTYSLTNPDPNFRLILDVETFYSPQPNSALTMSTGRSALDVGSPYFAGVPGSFHLVCTTEGPKKLMLTFQAHPNYIRHNPINKDLLRDPEFDYLQFITIPASGSIRIEHPLSLEQILLENPTVKREELKAGMKYRVWMSNTFLSSAGRYSYWGDIEVELKDKKLSSYSPLNGDGSPAEQLEYGADVIAADGWALNQHRSPGMRGNVGRFGPVFEF